MAERVRGRSEDTEDDHALSRRSDPEDSGRAAEGRDNLDGHDEAIRRAVDMEYNAARMRVALDLNNIDLDPDEPADQELPETTPALTRMAIADEAQDT